MANETEDEYPRGYACKVYFLSHFVFNITTFLSTIELSICHFMPIPSGEGFTSGSKSLCSSIFPLSLILWVILSHCHRKLEYIVNSQIATHDTACSFNTVEQKWVTSRNRFWKSDKLNLQYFSGKKNYVSTTNQNQLYKALFSYRAVDTMYFPYDNHWVS